QEAKEVERWFEREKGGLERGFVMDLVHAAVAGKRWTLAEKGARHLFADGKGKEGQGEERVLLAEVLLASGQWRPALPLTALWERSAVARQRELYAQTRRLAWEREGAEGEAMRRMVRVALEQPDYYGFSDDPAGLAHLALSLKERETAERGFLLAARGKGAESAEVGQLLYLWGPRPPESGRNWLLERAEAAKGEERVRWLVHLLHAGMSAEVVRLAGVKPENDAVADVMLRALLTREEREDVQRWVAARIASLREAPDRLRHLARLVASLDLPGEADMAWQAVLERLPGDDEALMQVAETAFAAGEWRKVTELLYPRLDRGVINLRSCQLMGESLIHLGEESRGRLYLEEAARHRAGVEGGRNE
ncbi:MAG: hypothetical protein HQL96_05425, partial [Magnetococcales bacterium]|nr:hypothetical protein [Magnetococcales bacterium]